MSERIASVFTQLFRTPAGEQVLKHLEKNFPEQVGLLKAEELHYYAGTRKVIHLINKLIKEGEKE